MDKVKRIRIVIINHCKLKSCNNSYNYEIVERTLKDKSYFPLTYKKWNVTGN
jgi:hypothetical protein